MVKYPEKENMEKINITVCMGSSCFARGNQENLNFIENFIEKHNLEADIELAGTRCENKCAKGPNVIINNVEYNGVTTEKLETILSELVSTKTK